jgi:hypothetical protein
MNNLTIDSEQVKTFFNTLWSDQEDGFLSISSDTPSGSLQTKFFSHPLKMDILSSALDRWSNRNLWFTVGLFKERPSSGRGKAAGVIGIPGLVGDFDCQGGVHKTDPDKLPTKDEALELINEIPFKPSVLIWSGGGYQAYWLFPEPWIFEDEQDKKKAESLSGRWKDFLVSIGKKKGWKIDSTASIEHLFRISGTFNCKAEPVPVSIVEV